MNESMGVAGVACFPTVGEMDADFAADEGETLLHHEGTVTAEFGFVHGLFGDSDFGGGRVEVEGVPFYDECMR